MRSIEERLKAQTALTPRRPLSGGFTDSVMEQIKEPRPTGKRIRSWLYFFRHLSKPVAAGLVIAGVVLLAGTSYAGMQWLLPHNTVRTDTITTLPNGNTRFWIHLDSCQSQGINDPADNYYEIKAGASITPQELSDGLETSCETDGLPVLFPQFMQYVKKGENQPFKPGDKQYFTPYAEVVSVSEDTLTLNTMLNGQQYKNVKVPLDSDARAFYRGDKINPQSIKPGDWITLVSYTTALDKPYATETMPPEDLTKLSSGGLPVGTRAEGFIKHRSSPIEAYRMYMILGTEWTRLEKDSRSPDGWRQIVPLR